MLVDCAITEQFLELMLGDGWHKVSWVQCIDPRNENDWLVRALRDAIRPIISRYKNLHPDCEICGAKTEHIDHVSPEFDTMAKKAIALLTKKTIEIEFARFDWFNPEQFSLSPSNPALKFILSEHDYAILRAVCKSCHMKRHHS